MSSVLPFDIIAQIIDIVGDNKDTDLLKELALVSHSFHQICSKHLFTTVELHDALPDYDIASSKRGFIKLLTSRPDIVKYIRKLTYNVRHNYHSRFNTDDHLLSPILPNFLRTISRLNSLTIVGSTLDWNALDSSLASAFHHLMHLPTVNHIDLSFIRNFPVSSLTTSVNLLWLDIRYLSFDGLEEDDSPEIIVQSEMMPKIRELHISESTLLTPKLLHAKRQDGQPAFNFMDLRRLSMSFTRFEDEQNIRYLLQNAELLEKLHLSVDRGRSLVGLLSPSARTLKVLDLTVLLYDNTFPVPLALAGICEELEAMAGHNMLEALSLEVRVDGDKTEVIVGSIIQNVEKVLVKPGWSALNQVSFKVSIICCMSTKYSVELCEALQSLPDNYLSHLSNLESVAFNFSAYI
jgi:hypothetical protein